MGPNLGPVRVQISSTLIVIILDYHVKLGDTRIWPEPVQRSEFDSCIKVNPDVDLKVQSK